MKKLSLIALIVSLALPVVAWAADKEEAKGKKVEFTVHTGYFESNKSGLKGEASYLAFTDQKTFDGVFGKAVTMGKKPNFLPEDAFDTKLVVATIKRGDAVWQYKVEKVTADDGVLYIKYEATSKGGGGSARYASPLIVSLDKGKYTSVVFIEKGKKAGTAKFEK